MQRCSYAATKQEVQEAADYIQVREHKSVALAEWLRLHLKWNASARQRFLRPKFLVPAHPPALITQSPLPSGTTKRKTGQAGEGAVESRLRTIQARIQSSIEKRYKESMQRSGERGIVEMRRAQQRLRARRQQQVKDSSTTVQAFALAANPKAHATLLSALLENGAPFKFNSSYFLTHK